MLLVSLELEEVMNLPDRILVMYEGEIVGEFDPAKTNVQELGIYMAGAGAKIAGSPRLDKFVDKVLDKREKRKEAGRK